jgi:Protein of unknown function (DUF2752)
MKWIKLFRHFPLELAIWVVGLTAIILTNPYEPHYSFCVFKMLGWKHCPGCGLGHSIAFIFRGDWKASWEAHPLGGFALIVILQRIYKLGKNFYLFTFTQTVPHGF